MEIKIPEQNFQMANSVKLMGTQMEATECNISRKNFLENYFLAPVKQGKLIANIINMSSRNQLSI